jgi:predicted NBD/HSP70 family sugar kinase
LPYEVHHYQYEEGDDIAKQILNEWAEDVAEGIAQIQVMYDPGLIYHALFQCTRCSTLLKRCIFSWTIQ